MSAEPGAGSALLHPPAGPCPVPTDDYDLGRLGYLALGEAGLGVRFDNASLALALGLGALVLIIAEGGLTTSWAHARASAPVAAALATVGVAVSIGVFAVLSRYPLHLTWQAALLLGAVLAPTDAAAVFSALRKLPLPRRLAGMLEGESGLNDAPAV